MTVRGLVLHCTITLLFTTSDMLNTVHITTIH